MLCGVACSYFLFGLGKVPISKQTNHLVGPGVFKIVWVMNEDISGTDVTMEQFAGLPYAPVRCNNRLVLQRYHTRRMHLPAKAHVTALRSCKEFLQSSRRRHTSLRTRRKWMKG